MEYNREMLCLTWALLLLSLRVMPLIAAECPDQCSCRNLTDHAEGTLSVSCPYVTVMPAQFPGDTREIFITTGGRLNILDGTFSDLPFIEKISISGDLDTIHSGAFRDLTAVDLHSENQSSYINFINSDILTIQTRAFQSLKGFSSIKFVSFIMGNIETQAFYEISDIGDFLLWFGQLSMMPSDMFYIHNIHTFNVFSTQVSTIAEQAFNNSHSMEKFHIWSSSIGTIQMGALGHMSCINYFQIFDSEIIIIDDHAFVGLSDVLVFEISNTTVHEKGSLLFTGMDNIALFDLPDDLVDLTPDHEGLSSGKCRLRDSPSDSCVNVQCLPGSSCWQDTQGHPHCTSCYNETTGEPRPCNSNDTTTLRPRTTTRGYEEVQRERNRLWVNFACVGVMMASVVVAGIALTIVIVQGITRGDLCRKSKFFQDTSKGNSDRVVMGKVMTTSAVKAKQPNKQSFKAKSGSNTGGDKKTVMSTDKLVEMKTVRPKVTVINMD